MYKYILAPSCFDTLLIEMGLFFLLTNIFLDKGEDGMKDKYNE